MEKEDMLEVGYVDGCFDLMHSGIYIYYYIYICECNLLNW